MVDGRADPHSEDVREGSKSEEREKKTRERLDQLADHLERMEEIQARQKDWMARDHQVGGMHMSGRDLEGFLRVMGDPKIREQISQKLREQGMSDKDVKKAEKEAQDTSNLFQKMEQARLGLFGAASETLIEEKPLRPVFAEASANSNYKQSIDQKPEVAYASLAKEPAKIEKTLGLSI